MFAHTSPRASRGIGSKLLATSLALATTFAPVTSAFADDHGRRDGQDTATPIKHLVVIFQENVSFDHYFGTYPNAANTDGTKFFAKRGTPSVNGLNTPLLAANPNSVAPFRLTPAQAYTCDQDHDYGDEQAAFDAGIMDKFPETVGSASGFPNCDYGHGKGIVMGYFDGNTTTALWNYAQNFAMSDNSYGTTFGPSTPGAINVVSGQTNGVDLAHTTGNLTGDVVADSVIGDPDPFYDDCSGSTTIAMTGKNVGDLLNEKGITWGWFEGGFKPTSVVAGKAVCGAATVNLQGKLQADYSPHHQPFQYYASTSNPHHLPPSSVSNIGKNDQANHQYDLTDFWAAVQHGNMPAVTFLKAKRAQDGHANNSSPLDEQQFIADTINKLEKTPEWRSTAVVISYDDSDGWYDHQIGAIVNSSATTEDKLNAPGLCGNKSASALPGPNGAVAQGRCGYGPRLPLLVVSPFAKVNFVDHTTTDQSSVVRFIEDNWGLARIDGSFDNIAGSLDNLFDFHEPRAGRLFLDPVSGAVIGQDRNDH
ncbi:MAG TPA: alkaline phosphatase family protein [Terriglobales bacterium]